MDRDVLAPRRQRQPIVHQRQRVAGKYTVKDIAIVAVIDQVVGAVGKLVDVGAVPGIAWNTRRLIHDANGVALVVDIVFVPPASDDGIVPELHRRLGHIAALVGSRVEAGVNQDLSGRRYDRPTACQVHVGRLRTLKGLTYREYIPTSASPQERPEIGRVVEGYMIVHYPMHW